MGMATGTDEAHDAEAVADWGTAYEVHQGSVVIGMDAAGPPLALQQGQVCSSERNPAMKESNRIFDELFMRISLQNREFSLIIVYVGGAGASRVGHDPVYGRHTGM